MAEIQHLAHLNLNKNELRKAVWENLASAPSSPVAGQMYWNTSDNTLYLFTGAAWVSVMGDITDVQGTLPIVATVNASGVATISINPATTSAAGSMSAADKAKLDAATANNTPSTLVQRDGSGNFSAADPTSAQHVATKAYVDAAAQGLDVKYSVKAASIGNLTLSGTQTVDGVALVANDRVLVKDQTTAASNGIYIVAAGAWTRSTDMDAWLEVPGAFTFVEQGTTNADSGWVCTSDQGGTLGTTSITWSQFSGAGSISAGAGLVKTGNTIDVVAADASIVVNSDSVRVGRDDSSIKSGASGIYVDGYTFVSGATVTRKVVATGVNIGTAAGVQTITHNLNTRDLQVRVFQDSAPYNVLYCEISHTNLNSVSVSANGTNQTVRVVVEG